MDDVAHVVMAVDVGVTQHTVEVLVYGFNDDMRVAGKDGDEGTFREEHSNLQTESTCGWFLLIKSGKHGRRPS